MIEILVAIVLVGILSAVIVAGVGAMRDSGARSACVASRDGADAAVRAAYVHDGHYPGSVAALVGSGTLVLADGLIVSIDGMAVEGDGWELRMSPGAPPTFSCLDAAATSTTGSGATGPGVTVCVRNAAGAAIGGADVETYVGMWRPVGTTVAGSCVEVPWNAGLSDVAVSLGGIWRQVGLSSVPADATGHQAVTFTTAPRFVRLVDSAGRPVAGAAVQYYAGSWQVVGTTGADGCASIELLPTTLAFAVSYLGVWNQRDVVLDDSPSTSCATATTFATAPRFVRVVDAAGAPVSGVGVQFYAASWQAMGTTGSDGCTSIELLPTVLPVGAFWSGAWHQVDTDLDAHPSGSCSAAIVLRPS